VKIVLRDLNEDEPKELQAEYNPKSLDLEFVDLKYEGPLHLRAMALKSQKTLHFWGDLTARVEEICARCLESVHEDVDRPFDLFYETEDKEEIDTLDDLREVLILEHPVSFLCRPDCKGLCPQCGCNFNLETCSCRAKSQDTKPFSRLDQIVRRVKEDSSNG